MNMPHFKFLAAIVVFIGIEWPVHAMKTIGIASQDQVRLNQLLIPFINKGYTVNPSINEEAMAEIRKMLETSYGQDIRKIVASNDIKTLIKQKVKQEVFSSGLCVEHALDTTEEENRTGALVTLIALYTSPEEIQPLVPALMSFKQSTQDDLMLNPMVQNVVSKKVKQVQRYLPFFPEKELRSAIEDGLSVALKRHN